MSPTSRVKEKSWITVPPRKKRAIRTRAVVSDVTMVLLITSLILRFIVPGRDLPFEEPCSAFFMFSRIESENLANLTAKQMEFEWTKNS